MKNFLLGSLAFVATAGSALAADMLVPKAPGYVFSWTGVYIGANVGWVDKSIEGSDFFRGSPGLNTGAGGIINPYTGSFGLFKFGSAPDPDSQRIKGGFGGLQLGYNHQFGYFVLGTELSTSWGGANGQADCFAAEKAPNLWTATGLVGLPGNSYSDTDRCRARQHWTVEWRNKLGVAFGPEDRVLGYVTGGVAITELSIDRTHNQSFSAAAANVVTGITVPAGYAQSETDQWSGRGQAIGVVFGGGLQFAFANNLSLGVEYVHTQYAAMDITTRANSTNSQTAGLIVTGVVVPAASGSGSRLSNATEQMTSDAVRLILNYKLDWSKGVLAKY